MGKITLYGLEASPPTRSCLLVLKALDLPYDFVQVNLLAGEHLQPEFLQKNPQHTVPVVEDDDACIWDSHAILAYLVGKYATTDALYPKDYAQRALVDQRLHYDSGTMFTCSLRALTRPILFLGETVIVQSKIDAVAEVYDLVETFLGDNDYVAGPELTIADFSYITTICSLMVFVEPDASKYPKINAWLERMKELPYYEEANGVGAAQFEAMLKSKNFTIEA
ncbi:glutathione S-transferase 1-like [Drosophila nasuta]|uniref:Glutathione S-transferase 1-like n=1 Tax=Drosophila albomicans TaxID=7291 RepID=A0A6P8WI91_DROAB|nr:glutathione S-transferase 1-like [Drosophila albomicans]XP_060654261.1 glutathione S-transferase 1-like [Drosophila nasuta]